ncbi:MAG: hypothetical protein HQ559_16965 [Lentisphaerae bacterium]|nr:hypothetical protein [Lentisphaerota bacterium]
MLLPVLCGLLILSIFPQDADGAHTSEVYRIRFSRGIVTTFRGFYKWKPGEWSEGQPEFWKFNPNTGKIFTGRDKKTLALGSKPDGNPGPDITWRALGRTGNVNFWAGIAGDRPSDSSLQWFDQYKSLPGKSASNEYCEGFCVELIGDLAAPNTDWQNDRCPDCPAVWGDPADVIMGDMLLDETDIVIPAPGPDLLLQRFYLSRIPDAGGHLGPGWLHTYSWSLEKQDYVRGSSTNDCLRVTTANGKRFTLLRSGSHWFGQWDNALWAVGPTNSEYRVYLPGRILYTFGTNGVLQSISDPWDNSISLTYTNIASGSVLQKAQHTCGLALTFTHVNGKLTGVTTPDPDLSMTYQYDLDGTLTSASRHTAGANQVKQYRYADAVDGSGHSMTQRVNAAGQAFNWSYASNQEGELTTRCKQSSLPSGKYEASATMDPSVSKAWVTTERDGTSQVVEYYIDPDVRRVKWSSGPGDFFTIYQHDPLDLTLTNALFGDNGAAEYLHVFTDYDDRRNVTRKGVGYCSAPSDFWYYAWDSRIEAAYDTLTQVIDPEGHTATFEYTNGTLRRARSYLGAETYVDTVYALNSNGLVTAVTNGNGHWVKYAYNELGRLSAIQPQVGPSVTYSNNTLGFVESVTRPGRAGDRTATLDVDQVGRIRKVRYPDASEETFSYDALGNLTNQVDIAGRSVSYTYAPTRKLTSISRTLVGDTNQTVALHFDYDQQMNTLQVSDESGRSVESYVLDIQDRPVTITNVENQTMDVQYGIMGYVNSVSRFDGTVVSHAYDLSGRLAEVLYPDSINTFTYFRNGLLRTAANSSGVITNYFNAYNRLTSSVGAVPNGRVDYDYLPAGQVSSVESAGGRCSLSYDAGERLVSLDGPDGGFVYSYHSYNGLPATETCTNSGVTVAYEQDILDRISSITCSNSVGQVLQRRNYTYDSAGMIARVEEGTGQATKYEYDSLDRLVREVRLDSAGTTVSVQTCEYDLVGNRTRRTCNGLTIQAEFPGGTQGNRLSGWTASASDVTRCSDLGRTDEEGGPLPYAQRDLAVSEPRSSAPSEIGLVVLFDGQLAASPSPGGSDDLVVSLARIDDSVVSVTNPPYLGIITNGLYLHDSAGCITNMAFLGPGYSRTIGLDWDSQYRLRSASVNGQQVESWKYDALGRRTMMAEAGQTNYMVYHGGHVVAEVDAAGTLLKSYTHGPGIDNILAMTVYEGENADTYYYLRDHLGSVIAITDSGGSMVEQYRYDAWGRVSVFDANGDPIAMSAMGNRYLWQGREYSWNTGLYYFRARWYDPITARWLSKDPIGISGGLNQYTFCGNNPVNYIDKTGKAPQLHTLSHDSESGQTTAWYTPDVDWGDYDPRWGGRRSPLQRWDEPLLPHEMVAVGLLAGPVIIGAGYEFLAFAFCEALPGAASYWLTASGSLAGDIAFAYPTLGKLLPFLLPAGSEGMRQWFGEESPGLGRVWEDAKNSFPHAIWRTRPAPSVIYKEPCDR